MLPSISDRSRSNAFHGWGLCVILVLSSALRILLAIRGGQFYWIDETRYAISTAAANELMKSQLVKALEILLSAADHLLFKVFGVIPALIEHRFEGHPWIPAVFFTQFSVGVIFLLWKAARALGASANEALLAAALMASCSSFFYYSRHVFPFDASLFFILIAFNLGIGTGRTRALWAGVFSGLGFLTYNGYWIQGGAVLVLTTLFQPTWAARVRFALLGLVGLVLPILLIVALAAGVGVNLSASFIEFSKTVYLGDFGQAWRFIPEYLLAAEGPLVALVWGASLIFTILTLLRGRFRERRPLIWLAGLAFTYGTAVIFSDVLHKFSMLGRQARPAEIFIVPIVAWALVRLASFSVRWRIASGVIGTATLLMGWIQFATPLRQVFPEAFGRMAEQVIFRDAGQGIGNYRVLNGGFFFETESIPSGSAYSVLLRSPHPIEYAPYSFEYNAELRRQFKTKDISMRVVRIDPADATPSELGLRTEGAWAPWLGALDLTVNFNGELSGASYPLLSTGKTGAGNLVFLEVLSAQSVRIGFDHWSTPAVYSDPIPFDPRIPHTITVSFGSLFPELNDPRFVANPGWRALKEIFVVKWDGETVMSRPMQPHPSRPDEIVLFHNLIGFSSSVRNLPGTVLSVRPHDPGALLTGRGLAP